MNAADRISIPLASIQQSAMARISAKQQKPRLTYSSVIHSLVERTTQRSPYLVEGENDSTQESEIALLYRDELQAGELLGQGNFSNVFEVTDIRLRSVTPSTATSPGKISPPSDTKDCAPEDQDAETTPDKDSGSSAADKNVSSAEQRRLQLRFNLFRTDGTCSYAVKCLKPELLEDPSPKLFLEAATDLVIEAKYLSRFNHENILKVKGLAQGWESAFANGEYDSFFILVDRLEETLNQRIKRWRRGELPEENTLERKLPLARQLASALSYLADRQLLFRDCKPQNIGLTRNADDSLSVKLFDFGFCRQLPVVEQSRDDEEDTARTSRISTLPSGELVYMMSGKGTRRYMAPEALLRNQYNLKADVYSFAMVCWELVTLHKPFYKYTKDQHTLLVCEGGDRPPLESAMSPLWPTTSFHSLSASLSSMPSSISSDEDSIDFPQVMTDPLRELLRHAWHQDVSQRLSMRQVLQALDDMLEGGIDAAQSTPTKSRSDLSNTTRPTRGYNCLSAEYGDVRDLVYEFTHDLPDLPFLACFGLDSFKHNENVAPETTTTTILPKSFDVSSSDNNKQAPEHVEGVEEPEHDNTDPRPFRFPIPQLRTLIAQ